MSGRHDDYKGSSRSTRDDSRQHKDVRKGHRDEYERRRSRSRSRSPRRRPSPPRSSKPLAPSPPRYGKSDSQERDRKDDEGKRYHRRSPTDWDSSEEEVPAPPPPPRITPISIGFTKSKGPIKMNIGGPSKGPAKKPTVASVFNEDDDEPEEMPAEAKMRMRNIGRETPTSAGPNSFGKTKQGFCDAKKVFEKNLKQALDTVEKPGITKFPQTIYKIKGP